MEEKPTVAFVLSLIGGIFILFWGLVSVRMVIWGGMMSQMTARMGFDVGGWLGFMPVMGSIELISGALVIFGAIMLDRQPEQHRTYGVIILIFSAISLIGAMVGFGSILGIVGGILAISWKAKGTS